MLYPVNPHLVAKYRQAFAPSRAKADPTDAQILLELLLKHIDKLQCWQPGSALLRSLQQLVENRRMLVAEEVRLTNRIIAALKGYYPQVLEQTRKHSFWAEAFYQMQRQKGKTHQGAIRALAFKWIRIVFRCWQDREPYTKVKYLMALERKGSPLVQNLALTGGTK